MIAILRTESEKKEHNEESTLTCQTGRMKRQKKHKKTAADRRRCIFLHFNVSQLLSKSAKAKLH